MIVTSTQDHLRLITQNDHANWAYQLLKLWPGLSGHPRREPILEATRLHDRGWSGVDASPLIDSDGKPHDFISLPAEQRESVWRQAIRAGDQADLSVEEQWRELLICHHAWFIHHPNGRLSSGSRERTEALLPLASTLAAVRSERIERFSQTILEDPSNSIGIEPGGVEQALDHDYRWLGTLDFLSLIACSEWPKRFQLTLPPQDASSSVAGSLSASGGTNQLRIDPYPLRGSYTLPVACRVLPNRRYSSDAELAVALARASWSKAEIRVLKE